MRQGNVRLELRKLKEFGVPFTNMREALLDFEKSCQTFDVEVWRFMKILGFYYLF